MIFPAPSFLLRNRSSILDSSPRKRAPGAGESTARTPDLRAHGWPRFTPWHFEWSTGHCQGLSLSTTGPDLTPPNTYRRNWVPLVCSFTVLSAPDLRSAVCIGSLYVVTLAAVTMPDFVFFFLGEDFATYDVQEGFSLVLSLPLTTPAKSASPLK